jgi:hypothetical protein
MPILVRDHSIMRSGRLLMGNYASDDGCVPCEVIVGNFIGEDLKTQLRISFGMSKIRLDIPAT